MPPSKLAHVVFQTNRIKELREWYCTVLGGRVIYENPHLSFVSYDDEHHRVVFVDFAPLSPRDPETELMVKSSEQPGLHLTVTPTATASSCRSTTSSRPKRAKRGCTRRRSIGTRSASSTTPMGS